MLPRFFYQVGRAYLYLGLHIAFVPRPRPVPGQHFETPQRPVFASCFIAPFSQSNVSAAPLEVILLFPSGTAGTLHVRMKNRIVFPSPPPPLHQPLAPSPIDGRRYLRRKSTLPPSPLLATELAGTAEQSGLA